RQGFRRQGLARSGRTDQQDVALAELDIILLVPLVETLVVVVDSDSQNLLGTLLTDHILIQDRTDLLGRRQFMRIALGLGFLHLLADDVVAQVYALVADEDGGTGDQLAHFMLALAAERAVKQLAVVLAVAGISHSVNPMR